MKSSALAFLAAMAVSFLAGCATAWQGPPTVTDVQGRPVCAMHRVPLTAARAYVYEGCYLEPEGYARIRAHYPNPWPAGFSPKRVPHLPMKAVTLTYCPECEKAFSAELRRRGM